MSNVWSRICKWLLPEQECSRDQKIEDAQAGLYEAAIQHEKAVIGALRQAKDDSGKAAVSLKAAEEALEVITRAARAHEQRQEASRR